MKFFKKLNTKGFSHLELLIVIVVVAAIAAVGTFVYEHQHNKAHAGGWTPVANYANADLVYGCESPSVNGSHIVTGLFDKPASWVVTGYYIWVYNSGGQFFTEAYGDSFWGNVAGETSINVPAGYTVKLGEYGLYGTSAISNYYLAKQLTSC